MSSTNRTLLITGILVILAAAGGYFALAQRADETTRQEPAVTKPVENKPATGTTTPDETAAPAASTAGTYTDYSAEALAAAGDNERVIFFHAPWCPQCRQLEADIEKNGVPAGVTILKADYDSNQPLRREYGVVQQTTVVHVDSEGKKLGLFLPYSDPRLEPALTGLGINGSDE
ncbi:thioredoxin family protein [Candidatus Saccharibacteria bacterium]|nr:thioredoxin family protein [Candidatus Saccharibacteria bacterium]